MSIIYANTHNLEDESSSRTGSTIKDEIGRMDMKSCKLYLISLLITFLNNNAYTYGLPHKPLKNFLILEGAYYKFNLLFEFRDHVIVICLTYNAMKATL